MTLVVAKGIKAQLPSSAWRTKGYQYIRKPSTKISAVRRNTLDANAPAEVSRRKAKTIEHPIANRKVGNTQSAAVNPNHGRGSGTGARRDPAY